MSTIIGIDVGAQGGIAVMTLEGDLLSTLSMPTYKTEATKSKPNGTTRVDGRELAEWLSQFDICAAYVEKVAARTGQGVSSMFSFGMAAGAVDGVLGALSVPTRYVTPQQWKTQAGLIGTEKDIARLKALAQYPDVKALKLKGKGSGIADAIFIAHYGVEHEKH